MAGGVVTTNSCLDERLEITIMANLKLGTVPKEYTKIQQRELHHHERRISLIQRMETHPIIERHKRRTAYSNIHIPDKKVAQSHHGGHGRVIFGAWHCPVSRGHQKPEHHGPSTNSSPGYKRTVPFLERVVVPQMVALPSRTTVLESTDYTQVPMMSGQADKQRTHAELFANVGVQPMPQLHCCLDVLGWMVKLDPEASFGVPTFAIMGSIIPSITCIVKKKGDSESSSYSLLS
ncbi:hypothetical protein EV421DRAFT_1743218 [Armillaria borealis]|uniref:Uncharacterized protein n=1 Tax=Armillaria borealis TaxID=47425 RepID=A0AA39MF86_9AGAR|nr:hypothetical protein EV421DRAFT_1743218 [Armillaria borealis]